MKSHIFFILWMTACTAVAQIDTTRSEFYPLQIGNLWQYRNHSTNQVAMERVIGDTVIRGRRYFLCIHSLRTSFGIVRIDSLMRLREESESDCFIYKLAEPDSTVWQACNAFWGLPTPHPLVRFDGIHTARVFGEIRDVMYFDFGGTVPPPQDTILVLSAVLARGIGVLLESYYDSPYDPYFTLEGAIINGVQYGTVGVEETTVAPRSFSVRQNYPNPFNPTTTITFSIPRSTYATLKIYNPLGQEIATLVSEDLRSGTYSRQWNATNIASGVYFYRLEAGEFVQTRKLVVVR